MRMLTLAVAVSGLGLVTGLPVAQAFECPELKDLASPALEAEIDKLVPKGAVLAQPKELAAAVEALKTRKIPTDVAVNNLIAFYCPAVAADTGLSDADKDAKVRQFGRMAEMLLLSN